MSIPASFDGEADFVRVLTQTNERLVPVIHWLDELHDSEKRKVTSAAFILLGQRILQINDCGHDQAMNEMSVIYHMIVDGGLAAFLKQDNTPQ